MKDARVREILAEIAMHPAVQWERLLARRFPRDSIMVEQGLLWLHAAHEGRAHRDGQPSLGAIGDQRYELTIKLDSGATASVWQAYDRKLGRNVAIKILHDHGEPATLAQVIAEARAACDVISDHVVRILDVHDDESRPYIVMELVGEHDPERGQLVLGTAASSCRPESIAEVVWWVMRVARGVHDAHSRNVFHRDLKPDNVLITPISRHARIADFGLAVSVASEDADPSATSLVTRGSAGPISVSGTPEYMAPEQARGLSMHLDPRVAEDRVALVGVDVWGIGALAYDLLSGSAPWLSRSGEREPWELAASGAPPPALDRTPWGERIPLRLRRIIARAMAIDPNERYETAARVANELEAFLARRPTTFDRTRRARVGLWCRRNPQLTLAGLVAITLILLTLGTRATVTRLRGERNALNHEVAAQEDELAKLNRSVEHTRGELANTEQQLKRGGDDLLELERSIARERTAYQGVLQKKEAALREAAVATRVLVEQLDAARASAEQQRVLYERNLSVARRDAENSGKDRDKARSDRDKARTERDSFKQQRDAAAADRDEVHRALSKLQQELSRLANRPPTRSDSERVTRPEGAHD